MFGFRIRFASLLMLLVVSASCFGGNKELKVGDPAPDYTFRNIYNYEKSVNLANLRGKLLILDFWNTGCASCIESWPKLINLQATYGDKIFILLVNAWQDSVKVSGSYQKWERLKKTKMTLPSVYADRGILEYFDVPSVPHVVWVDEKGMIQSITRNDVLNKVTIDAFLAGKPRELPQLGVERYKIDARYPFFVNGNGGGTGIDDAHVQFQSVFSGYSSKMGADYSYKSTDTLSFIALTNSQVVNMLRQLLDGRKIRGLYGRVPQGQIELKVSDTLKYVMQDANGEYILRNFYSYHFWINRYMSYDQIKVRALEDIKLKFGIDFKWEKKLKKCLVLRALDSTKFAYDGSPFELWERPDGAEWCDLTFDYMIFDMSNGTNYFYSKYPLLNETGYNGKVGPIRVKCDFYNHESLDAALREYGLSFTLQDREIDVLMISEIDSQSR